MDLSWICRIYSQLWDYRDKRIDGWLMMDSIKPTLLLMILYFVMVHYGPKWMKNRVPFQPKWILLLYNLAVAIINFHIFSIFLHGTYTLKYNWICEPVRISTEPAEIRLVEAGHVYLLSKAFEFLDTLFIIIRKKNRQLSFLHVYHHSSMLLMSWIILRWAPGGSIIFAGLVNSFVHVVMYGYYALSVLGSAVSKYLWWKKYLTIVQLFQFLWGFVFAVNQAIIGCDFARWLQHIGAIYTMSYLILFGQFYIVTYGAQNPNKKKDKDVSVDTSHQNSIMTNDSCYQRVISTLAKTSG